MQDRVEAMRLLELALSPWRMQAYACATIGS